MQAPCAVNEVEEVRGVVNGKGGKVIEGLMLE